MFICQSINKLMRNVKSLQSIGFVSPRCTVNMLWAETNEVVMTRSYSKADLSTDLITSQAMEVSLISILDKRAEHFQSSMFKACALEMKQQFGSLLKVICTDQSASISAFMSSPAMDGVQHTFDCWHLHKRLMGKVQEKAKQCESIENICLGNEFHFNLPFQ